MISAISHLKKLGFSEYEARAYTALLGESPLTAYEIAKNSGIPTSKVYEVLRKLEVRHIIQTIHGERSKMFVPVPPEEFVQKFKLALDDHLHAVRNELKDLKGGMDTSYTWHMKNYNDLILKAKRMIQTSQTSLLCMFWPAELELLHDSMREAGERGIRIAMVHYGASGARIGQVYNHPVENSIYAERRVRGVTLIADSREAIIGSIRGDTAQGIWSMHESFVMMAEDYIRHDIYMIKTIKRFDPYLKRSFGEGYEMLTDLYHDDDINPKNTINPL